MEWNSPAINNVLKNVEIFNIFNEMCFVIFICLNFHSVNFRLLLLDRDRQAGVVRGASPPPTYRSHAGTLLR